MLEVVEGDLAGDRVLAEMACENVHTFNVVLM